MIYNNNAQYNTMKIHNVVQYETELCYCTQCQGHCATMLLKKVHIVTMKLFPACRILPAARAASPAAAALMHACHLSLKPSRDLICAVDWSTKASRALCMPMLAAVRTTAPDRLGTGSCSTPPRTTHPIPRYIESAPLESTDCRARNGAVRPASMRPSRPSARLCWCFALIGDFVYQIAGGGVALDAQHSLCADGVVACR